MMRAWYQQRVAVWLAMTLWVIQVGCSDADRSGSSQHGLTQPPPGDGTATAGVPEAAPIVDLVGPETQRPGGLLGPGAVAPAIVGEGWLNGPVLRPEDLAGKVVVVDVWAFW